jgi:hypothetical protein
MCFFSKFLEGLEVSDDDLPQFGDSDEMKAKLASIVATKTQVRYYNFLVMNVTTTDISTQPLIELLGILFVIKSMNQPLPIFRFHSNYFCLLPYRYR